MITKTCTVSGDPFTITEDDLKFYESMGVPTPSLCPKERKRRRLAWQNMYKLYRRKCDATQDYMITMYAPEVSFPVYKCEYWWSDSWDPMNYGKDFDFTKPFFEQFHCFMNTVPHANVGTAYKTLENSDFINYASYLKNCYLTFHTTYSEDSMYCTGLKHTKDALDCLHVYESELCYECIDCEKCYQIAFSQNCQNCSESWFLQNCIGCKNCFGSVNLRNKAFYFLNKPCSPEEYQSKIAALNLHSYEKLNPMREQFKNFTQGFPHKASQGSQNENTSGDWIWNCQNVKDSFSVREAQDCRYCDRVYNHCKNCYDMDQFGQNAELIYEAECCGVDINRLRFVSKVRNGSYNVDYSTHCFGCQDSFGCVGLRNKKYCIFNKSYTQHEYKKLNKKITQHMKDTQEWGEFFPIKYSPFAYNETLAQEYFPLTKPEALKLGYKWKNEEAGSKYIGESYKAPDTIETVPDDICDKILTCEVSGKNYKIQKMELEFYKKMKLPLPRLHPEIRHHNRMKLRNPRQLYTRECYECQKNIQTTFAPERPEKVLCEECYTKQLVN